MCISTNESHAANMQPQELIDKTDEAHNITREGKLNRLNEVAEHDYCPLKGSYE